MTGEKLWTAFLAANVPSSALKSLGYDLYFARRAPGGEAITAVVMIGKILGVIPRALYVALNSDPGRTVLEKLAADYRAKKSWSSEPTVSVSLSTRKYIELTAARLGRIVPTAPPAAGGTPARMARTPVPAGSSAQSQMWSPAPSLEPSDEEELLPSSSRGRDILVTIGLVVGMMFFPWKAKDTRTRQTRDMKVREIRETRVR